MLRRALIKGGVSEETLQILIQAEFEKARLGSNEKDEPLKTVTKPLTEDTSSAGGIRISEACGIEDGILTTGTNEVSVDNQTHPRQESLPASSTFDWTQVTGHGQSVGDEVLHRETIPTRNPLDQVTRYRMDKESMQLHEIHEIPRRTIAFTNLARGTTCKDIVEIVKGGMLLDVSVRPQHRSANVTFVHADDAERFRDYAKRINLLIRDKLVNIEWNHRQYTVLPHTAARIRGGATRNIIIQGVPPGADLMEATIRDHLDHIDRLVVIDVSFEDGDIFISLNSVDKAAVARTCLASRSQYRGLKIGFYKDECACQIPLAPNQSKPERKQPRRQENMRPLNRFEVLSTDASTRTFDNGEDGSKSGSIVDLASILSGF
ncbi:MAG: hypothetical protein M1825_000801 [Sarcosagium campestre]|nr:MAG: hypothetical protein M1825_000801 [Sarcosagium campestre]